MDTPALIFSVILGGIVLFQLVSGKALDGSWRPTISRRDQPGTYWFFVLVQSTLLLIVVVTGQTSWSMSFCLDL